jgi:hypothetical protein
MGIVVRMNIDIRGGNEKSAEYRGAGSCAVTHGS